MENRSFEEEGAVGGCSGDDHPGSSQTRPETGPDAARRGGHTPEKQVSGSSETLPAYRLRYMTPEPKVDLSLEYPGAPTQPQEPRDERLDAEFLQQAKRRRERRQRQNLVAGACVRRPDPPYLRVHNLEPYFDEPARILELNPDPAAIAGPAVNANPAAERAAIAGPAVNAGPAINDPALDANAAAIAGPAVNVDPAAVAGPAANDNRAEGGAPAPTWHDRFVSFHERISAFTFQFPFLILQMTWPLATAVMGVINLNICFMNRFFPYAMVSVGMLGTLALLLRLYMIYSEKCFESHPLEQKYWVLLRVLEFIVLDFFAIQLFYFFEQAPSSDPLDKHYCKPRFYKINFGLMFVSSVALFGWIVAYTAKAIRVCRRRISLVNS